MNYKIRCLYAMVFCLLFASVTLGRPVSQLRQHFIARDGDQPVAFTLTEVDILSSDVDETYILIRDEGTSEQWILYSRNDYDRHRSSYEIRDIRGDLFLRMSSPLEFGGKT